jgi:hypothetical protein
LIFSTREFIAECDWNLGWCSVTDRETFGRFLKTRLWSLRGEQS